MFLTERFLLFTLLEFLTGLGLIVHFTLCLIYLNIFVFITMELWYSVIIGTVIYCYVQFFNKNARTYLESGRTQPFSLDSMLGYTRRESNPSQDIGSVLFYH